MLKFIIQKLTASGNLGTFSMSARYLLVCPQPAGHDPAEPAVAQCLAEPDPGAVDLAPLLVVTTVKMMVIVKGLVMVMVMIMGMVMMMMMEMVKGLVMTCRRQ